MLRHGLVLTGAPDHDDGLDDPSAQGGQLLVLSVGDRAGARQALAGQRRGVVLHTPPRLERFRVVGQVRVAIGHLVVMP